MAALAAAARIPGAVRNAFWEDEVASAHVLIQPTPWGMLHQIARTEAMPPLWYDVGWLANQLGPSPHGYRAVSVLDVIALIASPLTGGLPKPTTAVGRAALARLVDGRVQLSGPVNLARGLLQLLSAMPESRRTQTSPATRDRVPRIARR